LAGTVSLEGCDLGGRYVRIAWSAAPLDARSCPLVTASGVGYWHGDGMFDHGTDANCESGAAAPADAGASKRRQQAGRERRNTVRAHAFEVCAHVSGAGQFRVNWASIPGPTAAGRGVRSTNEIGT
jgi:hypothetical protein